MSSTARFLLHLHSADLKQVPQVPICIKIDTSGQTEAARGPPTLSVSARTALLSAEAKVAIVAVDGHECREIDCTAPM